MKCFVIIFALLNNIKISVAITTSCPVDSYKIAAGTWGVGNAVRLCPGRCPVTASSESLYTTQKELIADGNYQTYGSTNEQGPLQSHGPTNPHWFRIDLRQRRQISSVRLTKLDHWNMRNGHLRIGDGTVWNENLIVGNIT